MSRGFLAVACAASVAGVGAPTGCGGQANGAPSPGPGGATAAATPSVADGSVSSSWGLPLDARDGSAVSDDAAVVSPNSATAEDAAPGAGGASAAVLGNVTVAPDGKTSGAIQGYQWVSLAPGATGVTRREPGALCLKGTIDAVTCTANTAVLGDACNWSSNWGVSLGFSTTNPRGPWGSAAPTMLAVGYAGTPGVYNLLAHVAGDPDSQWYGIPNYASGQLVTASALTLQYWMSPTSTVLASFANVDMLAVFLDAEPTIVTYDFCVTAISTR